MLIVSICIGKSIGMKRVNCRRFVYCYHLVHGATYKSASYTKCNEMIVKCKIRCCLLCFLKVLYRTEMVAVIGAAVL